MVMFSETDISNCEYIEKSACPKGKLNQLTKQYFLGIVGYLEGF